MPGTKSSGGQRTPTEQLKARGSWRAKEREKTEPKPVAGKPLMPRGLGKRARAHWQRLTRLLDDAGMLTKVDGESFARYCKLKAEWDEVSDYDESTLVIQTVQDLAVIHKHIDKMLKINDALLKLEMQFGMTPASRSHVIKLDKPAHGNAKREDKTRFFKAG